MPAMKQSRMIPVLRHVLAARRSAAGMSMRELAAHPTFPIGYSQLSRFEGGDGTTDIDAIVTGYCEALRLTPREIWAQAWDLYGVDPDQLVIASAALNGRRAAAWLLRETATAEEN